MMEIISTTLFGHGLYPHQQIYFRFFNEGFNWDAFSAIVLAITAVIICCQVIETKRSTKYLEYQTKPIAHFLLITSEAMGFTPGKTGLYIKNGSKFKILFYIKIALKSATRTEILRDYWQEGNPLHVYPSQFYRPFPEVVKLDKFSEEERKLIIAEIEYEMAPSHAPSERTACYKEKWEYDGKSWTGPNHIGEDGIISLISEKI